MENQKNTINQRLVYRVHGKTASSVRPYALKNIGDGNDDLWPSLGLYRIAYGIGGSGLIGKIMKCDGLDFYIDNPVFFDAHFLILKHLGDQITSLGRGAEYFKNNLRQFSVFLAKNQQVGFIDVVFVFGVEFTGSLAGGVFEQIKQLPVNPVGGKLMRP